MSEQSVKPKFDKKKWRTEKYSKKVRVDQWQEKRKKYIQGKYFRMLQKEGLSKNNPNLEPLNQEKAKPVQDTNILEASGDNSLKKKKSFKQAREDFEKRKKAAEKKQKNEERKQKYQERQEAISAYKSKKADRYKILSKKTSKGQPLMAGRMEMLLEKIKETT